MVLLRRLEVVVFVGPRGRFVMVSVVTVVRSPTPGMVVRGATTPAGQVNADEDIAMTWSAEKRIINKCIAYCHSIPFFLEENTHRVSIFTSTQ